MLIYSALLRPIEFAWLSFFFLLFSPLAYAIYLYANISCIHLLVNIIVMKCLHGFAQTSALANLVYCADSCKSM